MNTDKAKRLLKKVQALFDNLSDQGTVSTLERDLLLSYLREFYEEVQSGSIPGSNARSYSQDAVHEPIVKKSQDEPALAKSAIPPAQEWKEPPRPIVPEPVHTRLEQITPIVPEPIAVAAPVYEHVQVHVSSPAPSTHGPTGKTQAALANLFEFKEVGELSEKLKLQPIERIEHGMGINERILSINELFGSDTDLFKQTLEYLNSLQSFQDAKTYLIEGVASRFNWADQSKKTKAAYFIGLVRRKYVAN